MGHVYNVKLINEKIVFIDMFDGQEKVEFVPFPVAKPFFELNFQEEFTSWFLADYRCKNLKTVRFKIKI